MAKGHLALTDSGFFIGTQKPDAKINAIISFGDDSDARGFLNNLTAGDQQHLLDFFTVSSEEALFSILVKSPWQAFATTQEAPNPTQGGTSETAQARAELPNKPSTPETAVNETIDNSSGITAAGKNSPATANTHCEGEPISMVTGEELLELTDFSLPGPIDFNWTRTYRSANPNDHALGHGWTHPLSERLHIDDEYIFFYNREGRQIRFHKPTAEKPCRNKSEQLVLHYRSDYSYLLKPDHGPSKLFRADGANDYFPLVEIRDAFDNSITIDYASGVPTGLYTSWQRKLRFICDDGKHITTIIAELDQGNTEDAPQDEPLILASYQFDGNNDLVCAVECADIHEQDAPREYYRYENHIIIQRTNKNGMHVVFEWDNCTPEAHCLRQYAADAEGQALGIYDYRFKWEAKRKLSKVTDNEGHTRTFVCNDKGQIIKETDAEGGITKRVYDNYGALCSETDPNGATHLLPPQYPRSNRTYYRRPRQYHPHPLQR